MGDGFAPLTMTQEVSPDLLSNYHQGILIGFDH